MRRTAASLAASAKRFAARRSRSANVPVPLTAVSMEWMRK